MLNRYFEDLQKRISKKAPVKKSGTARATSKKSSSAKTEIKLNIKDVKEQFRSIIPSHLNIEEAKPVDSNGFSPDGADLLVFRDYCRDIVSIMGGYIPVELLYATMSVIPSLDKKSLLDSLNRVMSVKKINRYTESPEGNSLRLPAFIVAGGSAYSMMELKNDILNYYNNRNIDGDLEFEIMLILDRGLVIKNWREKRSFIALETGEDSLMWFFILMNEYLDVKRDVEIDFRNYVKSDKTYNQY
jgi:hypothetical protein